MKLQSFRLLFTATCLTCVSAATQSSPTRAATITANNNATVLVNTLLAGNPGITFSNAVFTGDANAGGTFTGAKVDNLGIDNGIILSSGNVVSAAGANSSTRTTTIFGTPGDATLNASFSTSTQDAAVLSFDFTTTTGNVFFNYVFGSEEYPEFVSSGFNDVFGFFVDGKNIALIPNITTPIAIDNVNANTNSAFFRNNNDGTPGPINLQYDGFTTVLTAQALGLSPGTHTLKLAIADVGDGRFDSGVFLQGGSLTVTPPSTAVPEPFTIVGTLIGATAAYRTRKRLKATNKL
jgi:hypothetical protein